MCGIAGYNVSDRIFDKYLKDKPDIQKEMLRKAWLHNLHRGMDACGYMGQTADHSTDWYKSEGHAVDALIEEVDKDEFIVEPFTVFGAHTRAATDGDPRDNKNNHPVTYGKWVVTHNGQIGNHKSLMEKYIENKKERKKWPEVDSAVIPLLLEKNMDSAYDVQGLYDACRELKGAFAFHAINENYPGVSIFVRGTGRPLTIANLRGHMFAYGSEPESVWSLIKSMGINPNKGFDWWSLDTEHFLIIERGEIVDYGGFRTSYSGNTRSTVARRWLPREEDRERTLVYSDDSDSVFANKAKKLTIRGNEEKATLIYTRKDGMVDPKRELPYTTEANAGAPLSEADVIYEIGSYWHALYGPVEVVMSEMGRTLKDVYNHKLPFTMGQRFEYQKKKSLFKDGIPGRGLELIDFLRLRTTDIKDFEIPEKEPEYQYIEDMRKAQEEKEKKEKEKVTPIGGKGSAPARTNTDSAGGDNISKEEGLFEEDDETFIPEIIAPSDKLTWDTVFDETVPHSWEPLFFLQDRICPTHNQILSQHTNPELCDVVLYAASYAMAACSDMDLYNAHEYEAPMDYATDDKYCAEQDTPQQCNFVPAELVKVTNTYTSWYVRVSEFCTVCGAYRSLREDPSWFQLINVSDRMSIIPQAVS